MVQKYTFGFCHLANARWGPRMPFRPPWRPLRARSRVFFLRDTTITVTTGGLSLQNLASGICHGYSCVSPEKNPGPDQCWRRCSAPWPCSISCKCSVSAFQLPSLLALLDRLCVPPPCLLSTLSSLICALGFSSFFLPLSFSFLYCMRKV